MLTKLVTKNFSALLEKTSAKRGCYYSNFYNSFFNEVIKGINDASRDYGYNTMVLETNDSVKRRELLITYLLALLMD